MIDGGIDSISNLIGLDIDKIAKEIILKESPPGKSKRQIAKPVS